MRFAIVLLAALSASLTYATDYTAYTNEYEGSPGGDDHCGVFVETLAHGEGTGVLFHVVGSVGPGAGMKFEYKEVTRDVAGSPSFKSKSPIGYISDTKLSEVHSLAQSLPPPKSIFKGMRKIQPPPPKYNCRNWAQDLVQELRSKGILKSSRSRTPSPERGGTASGRQSPSGSTKSTHTSYSRRDLVALKARAEFAMNKYLFAREVVAASFVELRARHLEDRELLESRTGSDEIWNDWGM